MNLAGPSYKVSLRSLQRLGRLKKDFKKHPLRSRKGGFSPTARAEISSNSVKAAGKLQLRPLRNPAEAIEEVLEICLNRFSAPNPECNKIRSKVGERALGADSTKVYSGL
jgi:hypothetical protein